MSYLLADHLGVEQLYLYGLNSVCHPDLLWEIMGNPFAIRWIE
jgi:hypothetical protein